MKRMTKMAETKVQMPPGIVVNFPFLLKFKVMGEAYLSYFWSQEPMENFPAERVLLRLAYFFKKLGSSVSVS